MSSAAEWERMQAASTSVALQQCDASEEVHVRRLVALVRKWPRLAGVWHAAGVLADGMLPKQSARALADVCAPKARSAWSLQHALATEQLRTCAFFSSVAALLGGTGQANYAAANACLDALASRRRACSAPGVSVQWGAWAEVGMAARGVAGKRMAALEATSGFHRIGLAQGLGALHVAVSARAPSRLGVVPVQWERLPNNGAVPVFLSDVIPISVERVAAAAAAPCEANTVSLETVLEMVRHTAGSSTIDADIPLMRPVSTRLGRPSCAASCRTPSVAL
jgi:hypothetical protein